jgi:CRP/FNR family transcriptional regulator
MPSVVPNLLQFLTQDQKSVLESESRQLTLAAGECLFEKGERADNIYFVNKGKVTLYRLMPNGEEKVFKVFLPSGLIAEMAIFMTPRIYPMSAHIDQITTLTCYSYESLNRILKSDSDLAMKVVGFMSDRVGQLMDSLDMLTQVNANQRLVMYFADIYRKQKQHGNRFILPNTKKVLATQLGITPETLSRLLNKLKHNGLIKESGACITVPNFSILCHAVDLIPSIFE